MTDEQLAVLLTWIANDVASEFEKIHNYLEEHAPDLARETRKEYVGPKPDASRGSAGLRDALANHNDPKNWEEKPTGFKCLEGLAATVSMLRDQANDLNGEVD